MTIFLEVKLRTVLSLSERPCVTVDSPSQAQTSSHSQQSSSPVSGGVLDPSVELCYQLSVAETLQ